MSRKRSRYKKVCIAAAAVGAASPLFGQTVATWAGAASGSWTDASHWSVAPLYPNDGTPAGATYDAVVGAAGSAYTVGLGSDVTLQSFTLNAADATFAQSGGTLDVGEMTLQAGTYTATGGVLLASSIGGPAGAAINVAGPFTINAGAVGVNVVTTAGSALTLTGAITSPGMVTVNGGTVSLGGFINGSSVGSIHNNGGTVVISGQVSNSGTLSFGGSAGSWQLAPGGAIGGGTVAGTAPNSLIALGGTLTGVTVAGSVAVGDGTATNVALTASKLSLATGARLAINAPAGTSSVGVLASGVSPTLNGAAEVVFDGAGDGGFVRAASGGQSLTFGPALTVRTGTSGGTLGGTGTGVVNKGLLSARTAGRTLSAAGTFNNQGTVEARNGSTLSLAADPANLSGGTLTGGTWNVFDSATIAFPAGATVTTNAATVTLSGAGSTFAAMNALASNTGSLNVAGGKLFTTAGDLSNGGTISVGTASALKVAGTLTNTGKVDLAGGALVLDYAGASPVEMLRAQLAAGRDGGTWAGATGVTSSTAAADLQHRMAVGYAEASALGVSSWAGVGVDSTAAITKVTWYGDANLDGTVNADDYALLDRGYARHLTGWVNGDFDYSGAIDAADFMLVDRVYLQQVGTLSPALLAEREAQFGPAYAAQLMVIVPEPAAVMLVAAGAPLVVRRRRRS